MAKKEVEGLVAVIYARYSSENQREESIEGQMRECYAFAKKNGISVVGEYIDRAFSAKTDRRPDFQRMIKDSAKHNFNLVIVWKLDRFARNRYDSAHYKALLKKNGVKVMSAVERISDGAEGILLESVLEGMAEYYSADLSEKVLRGHTENALKCKYNGGTMPIGYYADKEQHYVADSLTAPFVLEAFRHYDEGLTMSEIAAVLNQHGLKNKRGGDIDIDSVSRMLSNRKYIGEYRYRDIIIPNGIPALVPQDLFDRVQEKIAKNKKAPARHKAEDDYLLTTKLFCGECESLMVGECGTSRSGTVHHYYKCTNAKRHGGCRKKAIKKDWIENLVVLEIRKKLEDACFIDDIVHAFMEFQTAENTVIPHLKQSLAELNKSIDNILAAIEQGIFTQSTKQRLEELESKKKDIEIEIAKESIRRPLLNEDQVRFGFERLRNLNINELSHRKRLIDTFLNSVFVYDDKLLINCNYPNTSTIVRFSDINATLSGSDILACGRPLQDKFKYPQPKQNFGSEEPKFCLYISLFTFTLCLLCVCTDCRRHFRLREVPAVVSIEIHLLYLAHQRISRICSRALVVKCLLGHIVEPCKEICLIYIVIAYRFLYADALLERVYRLYEIFVLFDVTLAAKPQIIGNLCIACERMRMVIL